MLSIHRHKRNLPSVPSDVSSNGLQLRRANSESRFSLPAVSVPALIPQQNIDDESDLLEIDLNDPIGSMNRTLRSKTEVELKTSQQVTTSNDNIPSKVKQLRDQTTNTPPISNFSSSIKSKKKLKKKSFSPSNSAHDQTPSPVLPPTTKLQKVFILSPKMHLSYFFLQSTSTEITYPFPTTKLILNSSRHGNSTDRGFRITGGHSIPHCMEVTACIVNINPHHRNYENLKNIVQEGLFSILINKTNFFLI
jgi:hypothetical protein